METMKVYKKESRASLPVKEHGNSLGYAIYNLYHSNIPKYQTIKLKTGIVLEEKSDKVVMILARLPFEKQKSLEIKEDFIGLGHEVTVTVKNLTDDFLEVTPNVKLSKFVILKCSTGEPNVVDELDSTERGLNGFGSTGKF